MITEKFMELGTALEVVHAMAKRLYEEHGEICKPAKCPEDVTTALDTVKDFIVYHWKDENNREINKGEI